MPQTATSLHPSTSETMHAHNNNPQFFKLITPLHNNNIKEPLYNNNDKPS